MSPHPKANTELGSQDDANPTADISEYNHTIKGLHGLVTSHVARSGNGRVRSLPVIPILLVIMIAFHILAAVFLSGTGSFSFNNPLSYGMAGLLIIFVVSKLKHMLDMMRIKDKNPMQEITNSGLGDTTNAQDEQH